VLGKTDHTCTCIRGYVLYLFIICRSVTPGASSRSWPYKEDPCTAQGKYEVSPKIEIDPTYVFGQTSDSEQSPPTSSYDEPGISLQPTPHSFLYSRKPRRARAAYGSTMTEEYSDTEVSLAGSSPPPVVRRTRGRPRGSHSARERRNLSSPEVEAFERPLDQKQLVSALFLPTSPLLNENMKVYSLVLLMLCIIC